MNAEPTQPRTQERAEEAALVVDQLLATVEAQTHLDDLHRAHLRLSALTVQMATALRLGQPVDEIQRKIRLLRPSLTSSVENYRREALALLEHLEGIDEH